MPAACARIRENNARGERQGGEDSAHVQHKDPAIKEQKGDYSSSYGGVFFSPPFHELYFCKTESAPLRRPSGKDKVNKFMVTGRCGLSALERKNAVIVRSRNLRKRRMRGHGRFELFVGGPFCRQYKL